MTELKTTAYPMSGVRILELGTHVAVPSATRILAAWGADVIKVESLKGDQWRVVGRNQKCPINDDENPFFDIQNANKSLIALNLKAPEGFQIFMRLLEQTDIFVTNMRLPALKRLGIDYETLKERLPRLIYGHFTGYGYLGPDSEKPGFDSVAFWSRSGAMADWVTGDSYPLQPPTGAGDMMSGALLCSGLLAALVARQNSGRGTLVSNSLFGSAIWYSSAGVLSTQYGNTFPKAQDRPLNPLGYPYRCRDGQWVMLGVADYNGLYAKTCDVLGIAEYREDARFATITAVREHTDLFVGILREAFLRWDSAEIVDRFSEHNMVCGRLFHMADIYKDPQAVENGYVQPVHYASGKDTFFPEVPVSFSDYESRTASATGPVGMDTGEVLESMGYTAGDIADLRDRGVVK
ncbi:MAG: CoA transferase [Oscillospiraceae bacterium]|nr:CoA transferase [Oscillospiraceae bacterium]